MTNKQRNALIDEAIALTTRLDEIKAKLLAEHEETAEKKFFNADGTNYCTYVEGSFPMVKDMAEIERIFKEELHREIPMIEGTPRRPYVRIGHIKK